MVIVNLILGNPTFGNTGSPKFVTYRTIKKLHNSIIKCDSG